MFRNPIYLLWMIPGLLAAGASFAWAQWRRKRLTEMMGNPETISRLLPPERIARR